MMVSGFLCHNCFGSYPKGFICRNLRAWVTVHRHMHSLIFQTKIGAYHWVHTPGKGKIDRKKRKKYEYSIWLIDNMVQEGKKKTKKTYELRVWTKKSFSRSRLKLEAAIRFFFSVWKYGRINVSRKWWKSKPHILYFLWRKIVASISV